MSKESIRLRFAPAPTGMMHLGNIRTALMNYLFAKGKNGTFILRIEDTDPERNYDPEGTEIISDLHWLGIDYDEGPIKGGAHKPYFQSKRTDLYHKHLDELITKKAVYRCFCTQDELTRKRERQRALKQPPRYDRACLKRSDEEVQDLLTNNVPFVWRVKLDHTQKITIYDLSHGDITFDLSHFSDFPITRQNGSFTFMFANFVDDMTMGMTHVFRGDDHLSNTAGQAALYTFFSKKLPTFWHMPILCNIDGKKLSKRDFGFSLRDLKNAGFAPEAICNYLAILGGSFEQEVMSLQELASTLNFDKPHGSGQIKYSVEKLKWMNHKWIMRYSDEELIFACKPFLIEAYPSATTIDDATLKTLINTIKPEMTTFKDVVPTLAFYFEDIKVTSNDLTSYVSSEYAAAIGSIIQDHLGTLDNPESFAKESKQMARDKKIPLKEFFSFIRLALTGKAKGPSIAELVLMLGKQKAQKRLEFGLQLLSSAF